MAELQKFMFEVSFDEETIAKQEAAAAAAQEAAAAEESAELEKEAATFTEQQLDAARDEGFEAGKEAGIRQAADAIETKINDALDMIAVNFEELFKRQTLDTADIFTDAVNIAVAIARKSFPHLNETHGFPEIEQMVKEVLTEVLEEPRVIIHISPVLKPALDERIAGIAKDANFEGQVILLEDEDMTSGDCRVAWSSGSAERDVEGTLNKIGQIVADNLGTVKEEVVEHMETQGVDAPSSPSRPSTPPPPEPADAAPEPEPDTESAAPETAEAVDPTAAEAIDATPDQLTPESIDEPAAGADSPPPMPSDEMIADADSAPEPAENLDSDLLEEDLAAAGDDADDTPETPEPSVPAEDVDAMMAAHLQAGPGSMEPAPNGAILNDADGDDADAGSPSGAEYDLSADFDPDATADSLPPMGPNR